MAVCIDYAIQVEAHKHIVQAGEHNVHDSDHVPKSAQKAIKPLVFGRESTCEDQKVEYKGREHSLEELAGVLVPFRIATTAATTAARLFTLVLRHSIGPFQQIVFFQCTVILRVQVVGLRLRVL